MLLSEIPQILLEHADQVGDADMRALDGLASRISAYARQHLNSRSALGRLPPELLEEIFIIVRDQFRCAWQDEERTVMEWIRVCTHVCHRWREVNPTSVTLHRHRQEIRLTIFIGLSELPYFVDGS